MRRRPLKDWWCMASQEDLPRLAFPCLWAEHKTCPSGRSKVGSYIKIKEYLLFSHQGSPIFHSWIKVGKALILEKRRIGKLEFREHNTEVRWGCRQRKVKIKSFEKLRKNLWPHRQDNREGNEEVRNAEEKEKLGVKATCHLSLVANSCHYP